MYMLEHVPVPCQMLMNQIFLIYFAKMHPINVGYTSIKYGILTQWSGAILGMQSCVGRHSEHAL